MLTEDVLSCSSEFALRSYLYIVLHELVGRPAAWLFSEDKVRGHSISVVILCKIQMSGFNLSLNCR